MKTNPIIQKVKTVSRFDGEYHNFFFSPGSIDSLERNIQEGWMVKFISDDRANEKAVIIFEREAMVEINKQPQTEEG